MTTRLSFDDDARRGLAAGLDRLADAVRVTLGPHGRDVVLARPGAAPMITNDGVRIAEAIELTAPVEQLGAAFVKEAARTTGELAGDGSTTATVLAWSMVHEGLRNLTAGADPVALRRGIDAAVEAAVADLAARAIAVESSEQIAQVAAVSAADVEIGQLIARAIERVGRDGLITVEASNTFGTTLDVVEGATFDGGYVAPQMVTDEAHRSAELEHPHVLLVDGRVSALADILPLLDELVPTRRPLLVVAEAVDGEALTALVVNKVRGIVGSVAVTAPGLGERRTAFLGDLAALTGATVISSAAGHRLPAAGLDVLGSADRVLARTDRTTVIGGRGPRDGIAARLAEVEGALARSPSAFDAAKLRERIAKLRGGVAILRVGAATEVELVETTHRIEDAVATTRAALDEGLVPGGGVALLRARAAVDRRSTTLDGDEVTGARIVAAALAAPLRQIAANSGVDGAVVVATVGALPGATHGYHAGTGSYEDLVDAGVVDATKVIRVALQQAASIAGAFLTTEAVVTSVPATAPTFSSPDH